MSSAHPLAALGWSEDLQQHLNGHAGSFEPARMAAEHKGSYEVLTAVGELSAEVSGRLSFTAESRTDLPAVGDWVGLTRSHDLGVIHVVLPRKSAFTRKVAGYTTEPQLIAANIDHVFVCCALDADFNLRRIERYLTLAWEGGAVPVVVLTKADLSDDPAGAIEQVQEIAIGADVVAVSALTEEGAIALEPYLEAGRTIALLGSSGVGKSTLVNLLLDEEVMTTKEIRWDGRGRHTTTHRRLIPLPSGAVLMDTPGMRELQLWEADGGLDSAFSEIAELASRCRFRDCSHAGEPGCAVSAALESGELDSSRYESYTKQQRELAALARRRDKRLASEEAKKWARLSRDAKQRARHRP